MIEEQMSRAQEGKQETSLNTLAPCGRAKLRTDGARGGRGRRLVDKMAKPLQATTVDPLNADEQEAKRVRIAEQRGRISPQGLKARDCGAWSNFKTGQGEGSMSLNKTLSRICKFAYCSLTNSTLSQRERVKHAFTLAEVLITLGIIGVVAAMTLPAVIQHHKEKVIITKLKKNYSTIQQAYLMALNEKGPIDTWEITTAHSETSNILYPLKDYLKIAKYCGLGSGCWYSAPIYSLNGEIFNLNPDVEGRFSKAILADGSMIMMYTGSEKDGFYRVDVNGKNPPNTMGKDIFTFEIRDNKVVPWGLETYPFDQYCNPDAGGLDQGRGCTAWLIVHENMDYLHCAGLSWNGKHSCKQK